MDTENSGAGLEILAAWTSAERFLVPCAVMWVCIVNDWGLSVRIIFNESETILRIMSSDTDADVDFISHFEIGS